MSDPHHHPAVVAAEVEMIHYRAEVARRHRAHRAAAEVLALEAEVAGATRWRWCDPDESDTADALEALDRFPGARWWRPDDRPGPGVGS